MSKIALLTDSSCDLSPTWLKEHDIYYVPILVNIDGETYRDGYDITPQEFLVRMAAAKELPKTSQPSPAAFEEIYQQIAADGYTEVIYVSICHKWSGAAQSAELAASQTKTGLTIDIIDSMSGTGGVALLVKHALMLRDAGKSREEMSAEITKLAKASQLYFVPGSLENLIKGGRVPKLAGLAGTLLNVRPLIATDDEGNLGSCDKQRGKKIISTLAKHIKAYDEKFFNTCRAIYLHTGNEEDLMALQAELAKLDVELNVVDTIQCGAIIATHGSANSFGIALMPDPVDPRLAE